MDEGLAPVNIVAIILIVAAVAYIAGLATGLSSEHEPPEYGWDEAFARLEREQEPTR
jgi:hypothetical protein